MTERHTDVLVIGGGTMGTAAGWAVARRGHRVRVLEQFDHVNTLASHGGISRIFRHAYAVGWDARQLADLRDVALALRQPLQSEFDALDSFLVQTAEALGS